MRTSVTACRFGRTAAGMLPLSGRTDEPDGAPQATTEPPAATEPRYSSGGEHIGATVTITAGSVTEPTR